MTQVRDRDRREVGDAIGAFTVEAELPFHVSPIYRCRDRDGRLAAVKVIDVEAGVDRICGMPVPAERVADVLTRYEADAAKVAGIVHPNLARVLAWDRDHLAIEWHDGRSLDEVRAARPLEHVWRLVERLLDALAWLHARGVVHGAIEPSNVFVRDDRLLLLDVIGRHPTDAAAQTECAKCTRTGWSRGGAWTSTRYRSPDPTQRDPMPQDDVYGCAHVIVELLAGHPLVDIESSTGAFVALFQGQWTMPPAVTATPWTPVLDRALRRDPHARFAHASELRDALEAAME